MKDSEYDYIFLGTGIISILEAIYHEKSGKKILMIDKDKDIGGAWRPISVFDATGVENAIHYFLYDEQSPKFMKNNLNWNIQEANNKIRLIKVPFMSRYIRFKFHNSIGRFISYAMNPDKNSNYLTFLFKLISRVRNESNQKSFYIEDGAKKIYDSVKSFLLNSNVNIVLNEDIDSFHVNDEKKRVELKSNNKSYYSKKLILTHGSRIKKISSSFDSIKIEEKFHPRPAVHLLIKDTFKSDNKQWIFTNNHLIKYVHDVTHISVNTKKDHKIFVFALNHHIKQNENIFDALKEELINANILNKSAKLIDSKWTDVFLPTLYDADLEDIKQKFYPYIDYLKTENFSRGIGLYSTKWSSKIKL